LSRGEPSKTLIAAGGGGTWGYHYEEARALTNRERARIQSFSDNFRFAGSFGEIRRQIGNAVPPEGIRLLARNLKQLFVGGYKKIDLYQKSKELDSLPIKKRILVDYHETASNPTETSQTQSGSIP
jgi:DNA (cytosine-5)-methyltransferase 1